MWQKKTAADICEKKTGVSTVQALSGPARVNKLFTNVTEESAQHKTLHISMKLSYCSVCVIQRYYPKAHRLQPLINRFYHGTEQRTYCSATKQRDDQRSHLLRERLIQCSLDVA